MTRHEQSLLDMQVHSTGLCGCGTAQGGTAQRALRLRHKAKRHAPTPPPHRTRTSLACVPCSDHISRGRPRHADAFPYNPCGAVRLTDTPHSTKQIPSTLGSTKQAPQQGACRRKSTPTTSLSHNIRSNSPPHPTPELLVNDLRGNSLPPPPAPELLTYKSAL